MRNFQDTFETRKQHFSAFSICMTVTLTLMKMEIKMKNRSHRCSKKYLSADTDTNVVNIKIVSV